MKHTTTSLFLFFVLFFCFIGKAQTVTTAQAIPHGKKVYFHVLNAAVINDVNALLNRFGNSDEKFFKPKYDAVTNVFSIYLGNDGRVIDINEILKQEFNLLVKQIDNPDPTVNNKEYNQYGDSK